MKPRVIKYYEANRYQLHKIFEAGRKRGLRKDEVYLGMEHIYNRARRGEKFRRIDLARRAFAAARKMRSNKYRQHFEDMANSKALLDDARATIAELEERLRRRTFRAKFDNWMKWGKWE